MTIETLDYIVRTIEALFYVLTGTVALLTYLGARKTILQPIKTEVFRNQVEVFTSIMKLFNGKSEYEIRQAFGFKEMLRANILSLLDDYAQVFFDINIDPDKRPYNKRDCPRSMITPEFAERYLVAPTVSVESEIEGEGHPAISKEEFWNNYIYGEICQPVSNIEMLAQLDEIMKSPFLTSESIRLLSKIKETVEDNMLKIGEVLSTLAKDLPRICPNITALERLDIAWIENEYNKEFISIDIYCNELTDYLRKYFKVESIME